MFHQNERSSRLIANAVIYYNTVLLSRVYGQKQAARGQAATAAIRGMSPVAWRHVNLIGKFEFSTAEPFGPTPEQETFGAAVRTAKASS